jgi:hypothetical protein
VAFNKRDFNPFGNVAGRAEVEHSSLRKMGEPTNTRVHLANEHAIDPATAPRGYDVEHWHAHAYGTFREGKIHYHSDTT